jgi:simple sugar transport system permease protein
MTGFETEFLVLAAATIRLSAPLLLAALAGLFAERAGIADLGLEGKMLAGAFAAGAVAAVTGSATLGLAAAIAAACLFSLIHFFVTVWNGGDQIVSGIAINIISAGLTPTLAYAFFPLGGQTPRLDDEARLLGHRLPFSETAGSFGFLGRFYDEVIGGHNSLVYAAALSTPLAAFLLYRTGWGLRLRAAGENPEALAAAGRSVVRIRLWALMVNGVLVGLAGAYLSLAANAGFSRAMTAGKGYLAVAALILGRWRPWPTLLACLMFAAADAIQGQLQGVPLPVVGTIPAPWITALPYVVTVIVLAISGRGRAMPRALGTPWRRTG